MSFDTENFIREVESRKAIWDITSEEYSDRDLKKKRWEEITDVMCSENLSENEKNEFGKALQSKWKNIRTSYSREVKRRAGAKSGSAALRKSPYVFFEQLSFLRPTVIINTTEHSLDEIHTTETSAHSGSSQSERPVSKKKKTSNDDSLVEVLRESIAIRQERERQQESDSDRLFLLSLLDDFKNIPRHRKLSVKMALIDVIKKVQMEIDDSQFILFGQRYRELDPVTSAARSYQPQATTSGQYRQEFSMGYGCNTATTGPYPTPRSQSRRTNSTVLPEKPINSGCIEALSPSDTNASDMSQDSEILELF